MRDGGRTGANEQVISRSNDTKVRGNVDHDACLIGTAVGVSNRYGIGGGHRRLGRRRSTGGIAESGRIVPQVCISALTTAGSGAQMCHGARTGADKIVVNCDGDVKLGSYIYGYVCRGCASVGVGDGDGIVGRGSRLGNGILYVGRGKPGNGQPAVAVGRLAAVDVDMQLRLGRRAGADEVVIGICCRSKYGSYIYQYRTALDTSVGVGDGNSIGGGRSRGGNRIGYVGSTEPCSG